MVDRDELFQTLWLMEACLDTKKKRKEEKRQKKMYYLEMKKEARLEEQENKRQLKEEFPKEWWLFEIGEDGLQWREPYFTILYTDQMRKLFRKAIEMLRCMAAEGREDEVKQITDHMKQRILFRISRKR